MSVRCHSCFLVTSVLCEGTQLVERQRGATVRTVAVLHERTRGVGLCLLDDGYLLHFLLNPY